MFIQALALSAYQCEAEWRSECTSNPPQSQIACFRAQSRAGCLTWATATNMGAFQCDEIEGIHANNREMCGTIRRRHAKRQK